MALLDSIFGKEGGGKNAGNVYNADQNKNALSPEAWMNQVNRGAAAADANTYGQSTSQVQSNPILAQLFGPQGALSQAAGEATNLAGRGYSMQPEDYEAYGQASGNIARMNDQRESGLATALASRGLSNSGAAGMAFAGSQGNKFEQLAGLQRQIADDRMKRNQERLNQTRSFMTSMGGQAQNAIGQANDIENTRAHNLFNMGNQMLGANQNQQNENLSQYQQTEGTGGLGSFLGNALSTGVGGFTGALGAKAAGGPMSGGGTKPKPKSNSAGDGSFNGGSVT